MKIYAVKDRLLNYFMQPFAGPGDKEVLAAIAKQVNGGTDDAIATCPHHYEIWRLGELREDGHITADKEFLGDASSLIRGNIRPARAAEPRDRAPEGAENKSSGQPGRDQPNPATNPAAIPNAAPAAREPLKDAHSQHRGGLVQSTRSLSRD